MKKNKEIRKIGILVFSIVALLVSLFSAFSYNYKSREVKNISPVIVGSWYNKETGEEFLDFNKTIVDKEITIVTDVKKSDDGSCALGFSNYYAATSIKLNGVEVYSYGSQEDVETNVRLGNLYSIVNLDIEKDVTNRLEVSFKSSDSLTIFDFDFGSEKDLNKMQFGEYFEVVCLIISMILIVIVILIDYLKKDSRVFFTVSEFWMCAFLVLSSFWSLLDSQILQVLDVSAGLVCQLSIVLYGLFPIALLMFVTFVTDKLKKTSTALVVLSFINLFIVIALDYLNIKLFINNLLPLHIITGLILVLCLIKIIVDFINKHTLTSLYLLIGYSFFTIFTIVQYLYFFINPSKSNSNIVIIGLFIFYLFLYLRFNRIIYLERTKQGMNYVKIIEDKNRELEDKNNALYKTFGRFVPNENINELISETDNAIKGSRMNLTVIQCDIRGFSDLIKPMVADEMVEMLNNYFDTVAGIIQKYNGTVISYIGDAVLAAFGTNSSRDNHASSAIAASLEIQKGMIKVNHFNKIHNYPILEVGIGINTGMTVIGYIGSEKHMKFDILGSTVNFCARMEAYSTGGQVLITQETLDQARNVDIYENYNVFPKGAKEPIVIYSVCGIGAPYNVAYETKFVNPVQLDIPLEIEFSTIIHKHVTESRYEAVVTKASDNSMMIKTKTRLNLFDDIQIYSYIPIYGKIIAKEISGYLVRLSTSYNIEEFKKYCLKIND